MAGGEHYKGAAGIEMETRCRTEIVCLTPEAISGLLVRPAFETRVQDTVDEGEGLKVTPPSRLYWINIPYAQCQINGNSRFFIGVQLVNYNLGIVR